MGLHKSSNERPGRWHQVEHPGRVPAGELAEIGAAAAVRDAVAYDEPTEPAPVGGELLAATWGAPAAGPAGATAGR